MKSILIKTKQNHRVEFEYSHQKSLPRQGKHLHLKPFVACFEMIQNQSVGHRYTQINRAKLIEANRKSNHLKLIILAYWVLK